MGGWVQRGEHWDTPPLPHNSLIRVLGIHLSGVDTSHWLLWHKAVFSLLCHNHPAP